MTTATLTRPRPATSVRDELSAKDAFALREQLRADGWQPLESSTDFRRLKVSTDQDGKLRTVVYVPEFKRTLGGAMGWWIDGDADDLPDASAFVERYRATAGIHTTACWRPES